MEQEQKKTGTMTSCRRRRTRRRTRARGRLPRRLKREGSCYYQNQALVQYEQQFTFHGSSESTKTDPTAECNDPTNCSCDSDFPGHDNSLCGTKMPRIQIDCQLSHTASVMTIKFKEREARSFPKV